MQLQLLTSLPQGLSVLQAFGLVLVIVIPSCRGGNWLREWDTFLSTVHSGVVGPHPNRGVLSPPDSKCGLWPSSLGINWGLV